MAEKTRYSDAELQEFKEIILEKLEKAKRDYETLKAVISGSDGNDIADTSPTFKVLEEGASVLSKEEAGRLAAEHVAYDVPAPSGAGDAAGADLPRVRDQQPHQVPQVICKNDKKCTKCGRQNGLISS